MSSCLFDTTNFFTNTVEDDITFGCEQRSLSNKSSISDFGIMDWNNITQDDEYPIHINENTLHGSGFQVWEKCMTSFINSLDNNEVQRSTIKLQATSI